MAPATKDGEEVLERKLPTETIMLKHLVVLTVLAFSTAAVAHADQITGFVNANGTDQFTSNTIQFGDATVQGAIGGTFATYLSDGDAVNFLSGVLPYTQGGPITAPPNTTILTITGGGETFSFLMGSYYASYGALPGCVQGGTCLNITGIGTFTGTGLVSYDATPGQFNFTSQYAPGQDVGTMTTFSVSSSASASPVPEPASLALFGTGLLGFVGVVRRKLSV
jgi:hypothetical protein